MERRKFVSLMCTLALGLTLGLPALAAPDFSGTWVLNNDKGENLGMVKAVKETVVIKQTADKVTLDFASTFMGSTTKRQVNFDVKGKGVMGRFVAKAVEGFLAGGALSGALSQLALAAENSEMTLAGLPAAA